MHGTGNDFIILDAISRRFDAPDKLAVKLCDRHYGVGADGVLFVLPSSIADFKMRIFNPDGSEAEMCGNGIRCFARYLYERNEIAAEKVTVETGAGPRWIRVDDPAPSSFMVSVGM